MKSLEIADLSVMIGAGFFFGSAAGVVTSLFSTDPEVLHWVPLAFAGIGFIGGRFLSLRLNK